MKLGVRLQSVRFAILMTGKMTMVFRVVKLCVLVDRYQRFGGTYCIQFQG
jgi:hypothetical protein